MELPRHVIWAVIGLCLVAIGALNVSIGRRAEGSLAPWVFRLAWLIMWALILMGSWIAVHAMFIMER